MINSSVVLRSLVAAAFVTSMLSACDDNKNNNKGFVAPLGSGVTVTVEGAIAEGGDGGDGGNVANQGGQIAQDNSTNID